MARIRLVALMAAGMAVALPVAGAIEPAAQEREGKGDAFVHVYVGQYSATRFNQIIRFNTDFQSSWLAAVGGGKKFFDLGPYLQFEWELQAAQHWGEQTHPEVNGLIAARWTRFPWNRYVDTSVAFGSGLSHAFRPPPIEERTNKPAERTLKFMLLEITATPASWEEWTLFTRIHHRSGVFGVVSDARGSNFISLGLRRHF